MCVVGYHTKLFLPPVYFMHKFYSVLSLTKGYGIYSNKDHIYAPNNCILWCFFTLYLQGKNIMAEILVETNDEYEKIMLSLKY